MKTSLRTLRALIWKDLVQEWRSRDMLTAMLAFTVLVLFIFNYALELDPKVRATVASGVLWVVLIFAGTLGINRSFTAEQDQGCFDGLLLAVPDVSLVYLAKMITNLLIMLLLALFTIPLYTFLYNQSLFVPAFFGIVLLGIWGYAAAGTLIASLAVQTRMRDLLLPILLFPLLLPLIMALIKSTSAILNGFPFADYRTWFNLILVYDILFTTISFLVFEYVVKE